MTSRGEKYLQFYDNDSQAKDDFVESRSEKRLKRDFESASDDLEHYVISKFPDREDGIGRTSLKSRLLSGEDNNNSSMNDKMFSRDYGFRNDSDLTQNMNAFDVKRVSETNVIRHTDSSQNFGGIRDLDSTRLESVNKRSESFDDLASSVAGRQDFYGTHVYGSAPTEFGNEARTQESTFENKYYRPPVMPHLFYSSLYDPYAIDKKLFRI